MNNRPLPLPDCPESFRVVDHIPMAHVANVDRSIEFYTLLGFACESRFSDDGDATYFASMVSEKAHLMLTRASAPVIAGEQAILFYMYSNDVQSLRKHLLGKRLIDGGKPPSEREHNECAEELPDRQSVFEPTYPFYMPAGEIRIQDPDGYVILVGQRE